MATHNANIVWHQSTVAKADRQKQAGHRSVVLWFTGLSGAGKSTLANEVERRLYEKGLRTYLLDGDNIRHGINKDLGFSTEARTENIRRIAEVAKLFVDAGTIVLTAFISPYRADRALARSLVEDGEFIEIYVQCALDECEKRDPKGLYQKAKAGEIPEFTGISAPYEEPEQPELVIATDARSLDDCVEQVIAYVEQRVTLS
ncbi:adenylyl-sulfate kinase [Aneurinibacillus sp. BA2021]|nr:adenylyl-sulfate kinase [Aneurinibacillus sp. BA2021]